MSRSGSGVARPLYETDDPALPETQGLAVVNPPTLAEAPATDEAPTPGVALESEQSTRDLEQDFDESFTGEETQNGDMALRRAASAEASPDTVPQPISGPSPAGPMRARRTSSGVTAALTEAALVDEEIAELRSSSILEFEGTAPGQSLADELSSDARLPEDTSDREGTNIKKAVLRRESRKRIATENYVLYGDKDKSSMKSDVPFQDDDESLRAITSAGRLEDDGASGLFGVLDKLSDDNFELQSFTDDEVSLETESKMLPGFQQMRPQISDYEEDVPDDRSAENRASTASGSLTEDNSEQLQAIEYGSTKFGSLKPDDPSETNLNYPSNDRSSLDRLPSFLDNSEEATASSVSEAIQGFHPPEDDQLEEPSVVQVSDHAELSESGFIIDLDDGPTQGGNLNQAEIESLLEDSVAPISDGDIEFTMDAPSSLPQYGGDEPTEDGGGSLPDSLLENPNVVGSAMEEPAHLREVTSDGDDARAALLVSEAFELPPSSIPQAPSLSMSVESGASIPVAPAAPKAVQRVEPVSMQGDLEPVRARPSNAAALRAVVERHRPAREFNRSKQERARAPSPQQSLPPTGRAAPTATPPMISMPGSMVPPPDSVMPVQARPPSPRANKVAYLMVLIALMMLATTIAVLVIQSGKKKPAPINAIPPIAGGLKTPAAPPEQAPNEPPTNVAKQMELAEPTKPANPNEGTPGKTASLETPPKKPEMEAPPKERAPEPPPKRVKRAPPKKSKSARRKSRRKARSARRSSAPPSGQGKLSLSCNEKTDLKVYGLGKFNGKTSFTKSLKPGAYRIQLSRGGEVLFKRVIKIVEGATLDIPCP